MVKLPFTFNVRGCQFQSALDVLRKSAQTGSTALGSEIKELEQQLEDYRQSGEFEGERDEEGYVISDRADEFDYQLDFVLEASMELRKAFAIAAYHHWERSVRQWIVEESGTARCDDSNTEVKEVVGFDKLSKIADKLGYPIDPALKRVVTLVNTLKHVNEKHGVKLMECWPEIFPLQFTGPSRSSDWADAIQLTDRHLAEVFDIVSKSGPTISFGLEAKQADHLL